MLFNCRPKTYCLFQLVFVLLLTGALPIIGHTESTDTAKTATHKQCEATPSVTMTLKNISISKAAALIGEQTGYRILLQGIAADLSVTGQFSEIDLPTVFTNLLREYNLGILVDQTTRQITIQSLGKKLLTKGYFTHNRVNSRTDSLEEMSQEPMGGDIQNSSNNADDDRDPFTGQTHEEIAALHREQSAEIDRELSNPNTIDTLTGMTYGEITELHNSQRDAIAGSKL